MDIDGVQTLDFRIDTASDFDEFALRMVRNLNAVRPSSCSGHSPACRLARSLQPYCDRLLEHNGVEALAELPLGGDLPEGIVEELMALKAELYDPYMPPS